MRRAKIWCQRTLTILTLEAAFEVYGFKVDRRLLWRKPDSTGLACSPGSMKGLVTRVHAVYHWRKPPLAALGMVLLEFGDFVMMRRVLLKISNKPRLRTAPGTRRR